MSYNEETENLIAGSSHYGDSDMASVADLSINQSLKKENEEVKTEEELLEYMVDVPEEIETSGFTLKKFFKFVGPGFLMSIAYLDPGNIESDLQSGAVARYKLLWVLLFSHIIGFILQTLSARLGVVSGKNLAEICRDFFPPVPRLFVWVCIEIAIIGSDMQEVIGTSVALFMLSRGRIPLFMGVLITILDTLTFLFIERFGVRKLEGFFAFLIAIMAVTFGFEFFTAKPNAVELVKGIFLPFCSRCGQREFLQGISIVGAVIMPHNLYLHSALVKSRRIERKRKQNITEANLFYLFDSGFALICSFIINMFVVSVFAHGLYKKTNNDVWNTCQNNSIFDPQAFPHNNDLIEADLYKGGIFLACEFGIATFYVWALGILASGQSSTMTGTYAGQYVMEGFIQIQWPKWKRVIVTRTIAIAPTLITVLFANGIYSLTGMNDLLNCLQMIILPFALIPIVTFSSSRHIMFEYRISGYFQFFALLTSLAVISINLFFSADLIITTFGTAWYVLFAMAGPLILYVIALVYLILTCLISMDICLSGLFNNISWLKPNFEMASIKPLWHQTNQQYGSVSP